MIQQPPPPVPDAKPPRAPVVRVGHARVEIALATVEEVQAYGEHLLLGHVHEAEPAMASQLRPNWSAYYAAEDQEQLIVLAAWWTSTMVGYAVAVLIDSMHYRDHRFCQHDLLYVMPEWRRHGVGMQLLNLLCAEARARGAVRLLMHAKPGSALELLLPRIGFKIEETIFAEDLCQQPQQFPLPSA